MDVQSYGDPLVSKFCYARLAAQVSTCRTIIFCGSMVFSVLVHLVKPFSELGYDLIQTFLFFRTGKFVSDTTEQDQFFGPAPTEQEAINKWASVNKLMR